MKLSIINTKRKNSLMYFIFSILNYTFFDIKLMLQIVSFCNYFIQNRSFLKMIRASIDQCRKEVKLAEDMFVQNQVPFLDTSHTSIEEIAGRILNKSAIKRRY